MRKFLNQDEKELIKKWRTYGILQIAGFRGSFGLGEAIVFVCSEHITHDRNFYAEDSVVIAVNFGAALLEPKDENDDSHAAIVHRFLLDQALHAKRIRPELPIVLIVDMPCMFAADEISTIIAQLDMAIRGRRALKEHVDKVSCLLRVHEFERDVFFSVDDTHWNEWYLQYEVDVLGRQNDVEADSGEDFGELVDTRR